MSGNDVKPAVAFVGFGEAAMAFKGGWDGDCTRAVSAFDIKSEPAATRAEMLARYRDHGVDGAETPDRALSEASVVFCLVTADQAQVAAEAYAGALVPGALWLDGNSCSPGIKSRAAAIIESADVRYVDMAIMAPVHPLRHRVPVLLSGPHAQAAGEALRGLGMNPTIAGDRVGQASSVKMLRSVMVKGLEALTAECLLAARRAGVEEAVLESLEASDPDIDWRGRATYNLGRMIEHGTRRASEMRDVTATVEELDLAGRMSGAAAEWQDRIGALDLDAGEANMAARLDRLLAALR